MLDWHATSVGRARCLRIRLEERVSTLDYSTLQQRARAYLEARDATRQPPSYTLPYAEARRQLEQVQSGYVSSLPADIEDLRAPGGPRGAVSIRIVLPKPRPEAPLPLLMYFHGGGWILGSANTHDRLVRELANGVPAAVAFVNYTPSPEAQYPTAIQEAYAATRYL